ncbi:MAG: hypothetical protein NVS4B11_29440 [Ktedonobacteraceae bacterium]
MQQGCYAEGIAILTLAYEQLPFDQMHLATALNTLLQHYDCYHSRQQALQEASQRFVEERTALQGQVAACEIVLFSLLHDREAPQPPHESSHESLLRPTHKALPDLSITCFGRFAVKRAGKPITLCPSRSGQRILRYLVAQEEHYATSDILQTLLRQEDEPEVAQRKLHIAVSALRRSLSDGISSASDANYILYKNKVYMLNPTVVIQTDVDEFLHYYKEGQQHCEEQVTLYEKACHLYTGPFLLDDIYADWSFLQRERLCQAYLAMCRVLAEHYLTLKQYEASAYWATTTLKENRCDETAHRQLIQIYAAQGYRNEALQQYQRCELILHEELGVKPLLETQRALQTVLIK